MTNVLNLDAIVAEREPKFVEWKGQRFEVRGVTGRAYLRFLKMQKALQRKQRDQDEAAQFELSVSMIILAIPDLEPYRDALYDDLQLPQLLKLVEFVSEELGVETQAGSAVSEEVVEGE